MTPIEITVCPSRVALADPLVLKKSAGPTYEEENAVISKNSKRWKKLRHKFQQAEWTSKNGHPRCLLCGDEPALEEWCEPERKVIKKSESDYAVKAPHHNFPYTAIQHKGRTYIAPPRVMHHEIERNVKENRHPKNLTFETPKQMKAFMIPGYITEHGQFLKKEDAERVAASKERFQMFGRSGSARATRELVLEKSTSALDKLPDWQGTAHHGGEFSHERGVTAGDVIRHERDDLGNEMHVHPHVEKELNKYDHRHVIWVSKNKKQAAHYGQTKSFDATGSKIVHSDEDGHLIFHHNGFGSNGGVRGVHHCPGSVCDETKKSLVLEKSRASEPSDGYHYHATNSHNAADIAHDKLRTHKPWHGTDQNAWPDGSTEKRAYFAPGEGKEHFTPEGGKPTMLRVHHSKADFHRESTGDTYVKKPIDSKHVEIKTEAGWKPLNEHFQKSLVLLVKATTREDALRQARALHNTSGRTPPEAESATRIKHKLMAAHGIHEHELDMKKPAAAPKSEPESKPYYNPDYDAHAKREKIRTESANRQKAAVHKVMTHHGYKLDPKYSDPKDNFHVYEHPAGHRVQVSHYKPRSYSEHAPSLSWHFTPKFMSGQKYKDSHPGWKGNNYSKTTPKGEKVSAEEKTSPLHKLDSHLSNVHGTKPLHARSERWRFKSLVLLVKSNDSTKEELSHAIKHNLRGLEHLNAAFDLLAQAKPVFADSINVSQIVAEAAMNVGAAAQEQIHVAKHVNMVDGQQLHHAMLICTKQNTDLAVAKYSIRVVAGALAAGSRMTSLWSRTMKNLSEAIRNCRMLDEEIARQSFGKSLVKARKLAYRTLWQGIPVSVENRRGSVRHWYDPHTGKNGRTKLEHPYGYFRGTKGMDGDAVDCFLGPDENATHAYVVTQMKAPNFKEVDEQKIMLGFDDPETAKRAYLKHYTNVKFFGSMRAVPMHQFRLELERNKNHPGPLRAVSIVNYEDGHYGAVG